MRLGFLYAGQGSQHPGMGADLYESYPAFRHVLDQAAEEVDFDLKEVSFQDRQGILNETRYTQPCMVAFAAGLTAVLEEQGVVPAAAAGLSLGEYSALHAAGVFDARTAVGLTAFRGRAMEEAAAGRESAMMAVLGMGRELLQAACDEAAALGCVTIANYNCPGQLVIGGERAAVERAAALAKEKGAKRCLPLNVSGPFHTPLMAPAGEALREYFKGIDFAAPRIPVVFNCLGDTAGGASIPELLVRQVQSSVWMEDSIRRLASMGLDALVEIGPGKALSGFVRKTAGSRRGDRGGRGGVAGEAFGACGKGETMNFSGKTAVVTGGSRGIGRAICLKLAAGGAHVVLCYAGNEDAARETAAECEKLGAKALAVRCNVVDSAQVQALMDTAVKTFGGIHILINNAGITRDQLMMMMKEEAFDEVISANLKGAFLCMKAAARTMMKQRYGRIVSLSSVVGLRGNAGQTNYAASKAGIIGLTKSIAKELASRGVTANAVAPGFIDTDMTAAMSEAAKAATLASIPLGKLGKPEDVAAAVAFLASEEAGYITGQVLAVDGGMAM